MNTAVWQTLASFLDRSWVIMIARATGNVTPMTMKTML